jgi:hypothetical protein
MENLNLLEELVIKEEHEVRNIQSSNLGISFLIQNKSINNNDYIDLKNLDKVIVILEVENIKIFTQMSRLFIHQLGQRVLKKFYSKAYEENIVFNTATEDYQSVLIDWHYYFNENRDRLKKHCIETLINESLVIKYYELDKKYILYGIVSHSYKEMKQTVFRDMVLDAISNNFSSLDIQPYSMRRSNKSYFAPIQENFRFNFKHNFQFETDMTISYGLNNGYKSYSLYIRRYTRQAKLDKNNNTIMSQVPYTSISIEKINAALKDGITTYITNNILDLFKENNYRIEEKEILSIINQDTEIGLNWRNNPRHHENHNRQEDIQKFLKKVFIKTLAYSFNFEKKLQLAKSKYYSQHQVTKFFQLMRIAQSSEYRIQDKIKELQSINGNSYYNISEAFREVGTFELAIAKPVQRFLIEVGTKFIEEENYLENCISQDSEILMTGDYSFVDN